MVVPVSSLPVNMKHWSSSSKIKIHVPSGTYNPLKFAIIIICTSSADRAKMAVSLQPSVFSCKSLLSVLYNYIICGKN